MKKDPLKISSMHDGATHNIFKNDVRLGKNMTEPEFKLWDYLKTKPLGYKFRRQHPLAGYILDFYRHTLRLSIEIDGGYHLKKEQIQKDKERTAYLKSVRIRELRFTNEQVLSTFKSVIKDIDTYLRVDIPLGIEGERKGKTINHD